MPFKSEKFYQAKQIQSKPLSLRYAEGEALARDIATLRTLNEIDELDDDSDLDVGEYDGERNQVRVTNILCECLVGQACKSILFRMVNGMDTARQNCQTVMIIVDNIVMDIATGKEFTNLWYLYIHFNLFC